MNLHQKEGARGRCAPMFPLPRSQRSSTKKVTCTTAVSLKIGRITQKIACTGKKIICTEAILHAFVHVNPSISIHAWFSEQNNFEYKLPLMCVVCPQLKKTGFFCHNCVCCVNTVLLHPWTWWQLKGTLPDPPSFI